MPTRIHTNVNMCADFAPTKATDIHDNTPSSRLSRQLLAFPQSGLLCRATGVSGLSWRQVGPEQGPLQDPGSFRSVRYFTLDACRPKRPMIEGMPFSIIQRLALKATAQENREGGVSCHVMAKRSWQKSECRLGPNAQAFLHFSVDACAAWQATGRQRSTRSPPCSGATLPSMLDAAGGLFSAAVLKPVAAALSYAATSMLGTCDAGRECAPST